MSPSEVVRAQLASIREATAYHEAGHAVAGLAYGGKIESVKVAYREQRRFFGESRWHVDGLTWWRPREDEVTEADAVFLLAGIEAEALWLARSSGAFHFSARSRVCGNEVLRKGDLKKLSAVLPEVGMTRSQAQRKALELTRRRWPAIERVAGALLKGDGFLSASEVRRLAG